MQGDGLAVRSNQLLNGGHNDFGGGALALVGADVDLIVEHVDRARERLQHVYMQRREQPARER